MIIVMKINCCLENVERPDQCPAFISTFPPTPSPYPGYSREAWSSPPDLIQGKECGTILRTPQAIKVCFCPPKICNLAMSPASGIVWLYLQRMIIKMPAVRCGEAKSAPGTRVFITIPGKIYGVGSIYRIVAGRVSDVPKVEIVIMQV